jgi:hypothetical protein
MRVDDRLGDIAPRLLYQSVVGFQEELAVDLWRAALPCLHVFL